MGMQSSSGASSMAQDILKLIENMRFTYSNNMDATDALNFFRIRDSKI